MTNSSESKPLATDDLELQAAPPVAPRQVAEVDDADSDRWGDQACTD